MDSQKVAVNLVMLAALFALALTLAGPVRRWMRREEEWFRTVLIELYMQGVSGTTMLIAGGLSAVFGALTGWLLLQSGVAALAAGVVGYALPRLYLHALRRSRRKRLNSQLVDGILTISNGVASGLNLTAALKLVEQNAPAPLSQEIGHLLREYEYGMPLEQAMERAADRVQLPNYRLLFLAMRTGMERGGKLAETLKNIAESLREIARLEDKVDTMTAQGRASARLMSVMPLVVVGILYMIDPRSVRELFTTGPGRILLAIIGGVLVAGWVWMHRVVTVDV
jgi:tight adherence protein B